jgi:hypothetical protein
VIERHMRGAVRSVVLDDDFSSSVPRMNEAEWLASCALVKGVSEATLQLLEVWVCESAGSTWTVDAVVIQGKVKNVPINQIALRLTLAEAARRLGWDLHHTEARKLYRQALNQVNDNLVGRVGRRRYAWEEGA